MRTVQGYVPFELPVKSAGQPQSAGQTFCRTRRPDGGWETHIGTHREIMEHLKTCWPGGKLPPRKEAHP